MSYMIDCLAPMNTKAVHPGWRWQGHSRWTMDEEGRVYLNYKELVPVNNTLIGDILYAANKVMSPLHFQVAASRQMRLSYQQVNRIKVTKPEDCADKSPYKHGIYKRVLWWFPDDDLFLRKTGSRVYKLIPGFTRYMISKQGYIYDIEAKQVVGARVDKGKEREPRQRPDTHLPVKLYCDYLAQTVEVSIPWLLARTWSEYGWEHDLTKVVRNKDMSWSFALKEETE